MDMIEELERRAQILIEQTNRLINILQVDVSDFVPRDLANEPWSSLPPVFASTQDAYERLAAVEKK